MKLSQKDINTWYVGKFQAAKVLTNLRKLGNKELINKACLQIYAYASATTDVSGPYIKISNGN